MYPVNLSKTFQITFSSPIIFITKQIRKDKACYYIEIKRKLIRRRRRRRRKLTEEESNTIPFSLSSPRPLLSSNRYLVYVPIKSNFFETVSSIQMARLITNNSVLNRLRRVNCSAGTNKLKVSVRRATGKLYGLI